MEGYSAADAVAHLPQTTLSGVLEKATEAKLIAGRESARSEFDCPERLFRILEGCPAGEGEQKVPVCLLYSTDTVRSAKPHTFSFALLANVTSTHYML